MIGLLCSLFVGALVAEIFMRLPLRAKLVLLAADARRVFAVIRSAAISDHWKEKATPRRALRIAAGFALVGIWIAAAAGACLIPVLIVDAVDGGREVTFFLSPSGIAVTTMASVGYLFVRSRFV